MSLRKQHALTLPANPRAVKLARDWVGRVLSEVGRDDLVPSAELGVSELVTNAIMHSAPPVAVRVRGTRAHPRIEVADRSLVPPRANLIVPDDDDLLQTFGRGLALVALHSSAWGSDLDEDGHGKTVWFEPVSEPEDEATIQGDVYDLDEVMQSRLGSANPPDTVEIQLLGTPVTAFLNLLRYYGELRRELRLLALTNPERYPVAVQFSEVALQVEQERRQTTGIEKELSGADTDGDEKVDLIARAPISAPATMGQLQEVLGRLGTFFEAESLLAESLTPRQLEVQHWYLGEFIRQGAGEEPRPWTGGYEDHRHHAAS
ncbi:MAG: ATP-binding region, ATPase domain protein [Nocardioidaceae bacterium]|nr:ATP-binding region, ATPase domain protein [Nocardioidaceae bacterium]